MALRQAGTLLRTCAAITRYKTLEPVQRSSAQLGSLYHFFRHFSGGSSDNEGKSHSDETFHRAAKPGGRSFNPSERELLDALSAGTGVYMPIEEDAQSRRDNDSLRSVENIDMLAEVGEAMLSQRDDPVSGEEYSDLNEVDYAAEMLEGVDLSEAEGEGEEEEEFVDPLEAQLEGVPRRMQRFLLQKMLKVKPTEPPSLGHWKRQFQMKVIDVNRTCKVTKGGGILGFTAFVVCGNGNGAVGFGKGKSADVSAAVDKAYSRSIRNLHYFERFEERTTFHPIVAKYEKTKVYLWPGKPGSGMVASSTVGGILRLAGFKDIKTKVIGSRHPHNTVKATFKALSLVKPPPEIAAKQGLDMY